MPFKKSEIIVTRKLPDPVEARMKELFNVRLNVDDRAMSRDELLKAVKTANCLVPTVTDKIDSSLLSQAGDQLKLIANFGNGVDNIDVAADGSLWIAGHPKVIDLIRHFASRGEKPAPSQVYILPMDNGLLGEPVDIFTSLGEDLSASSVAAEHNGKIYMGGITPRKMLVCEPG